MAGFAARPETVRLIGADIAYDVCWLVKGKTRGKFARNLLSTFLFWCVENNVEVVAGYLRTNQNVAADEIARLPEELLLYWGKDRNLRRMARPAAWLDFIAFAPHVDWGRSWQSTAPVRVAQDGNDFLFGAGRRMGFVEFHGNRSVRRITNFYETNRISI